MSVAFFQKLLLIIWNICWEGHQKPCRVLLRHESPLIFKRFLIKSQNNPIDNFLLCGSFFICKENFKKMTVICWKNAFNTLFLLPIRDVFFRLDWKGICHIICRKSRLEEIKRQYRNKRSITVIPLWHSTRRVMILTYNHLKQGYNRLCRQHKAKF